MTDGAIIASGDDIERSINRVAVGFVPDINDAIRANVPDLMQAAQTEAYILRLSTGRKKGPSTGLRRAIAQAVGAKYENEKVIFIVNRAAMPSGKEALPILTVQRAWRHPVFGNAEVWVEQRGDVAWFSRAIRREANRVIPADIRKAIERLAK